MNRLILKLLSTIIISYYITLLIFNINYLVIGVSLFTYLKVCLFNLRFPLFIYSIYILIKK